MATVINQEWFHKEFTQRDHEDFGKDSYVNRIFLHEVRSRIEKIPRDTENDLNDILSIGKKGKDFQRQPINRYMPFDRKNYFTKSQSWVGHVTSISENTFQAVIVDSFTCNSGTYEEVEFEIEELDDEDKEILAIGSVFYWSIGFEYRKGTKVRESILRFRRLPKWSTSDVDESTDLATELYDNLKWDDEI